MLARRRRAPASAAIPNPASAVVTVSVVNGSVAGRRAELLQRQRCDRHGAAGGADGCGHVHGAGELRRERQLQLCVGDEDDHDREGKLDDPVSCPASVTYNGSAHTPCTANVTGAGGLDDGVDVTYSDNTHAGTATASASYGGDANHKPSSDSKTFVIEKADASVMITWDHPQTYTGNTHPASAVVNGVGGETRPVAGCGADVLQRRRCDRRAATWRPDGCRHLHGARGLCRERRLQAGLGHEVDHDREGGRLRVDHVGRIADLQRKSASGLGSGRRCRRRGESVTGGRADLLRRRRHLRDGAGGCADECGHLHGLGRLRRERQLQPCLGHEDDHDRQGGRLGVRQLGRSADVRRRSASGDRVGEWGRHAC